LWRHRHGYDYDSVLLIEQSINKTLLAMGEFEATGRSFVVSNALRSVSD